VAYRDHARKRVIREKWSKPLIKFVHDTLGHKLTYLGLPSPEANDILEWIDYIDYVIAFQCRQYPEPSSVTQPEGAVLKLEEKLRELERKGRLTNFSIYDGYIEEVLIKGTDTVGNVYGQDRVVTIYNLDFCNDIANALSYYDDARNKCTAYKSDAIRELLKFQRKTCSWEVPAKFVMFLTIHTDFLDSEERRFWQQEQDQQLKKYFRKISRLTGYDKRLRALKTYVYQMVRNFFRTEEFSAEFLPAIYYRGVGGGDRGNWLVHFTVIGTHNRNPSGLAPCFQRADDFLNQKFLHISKGKLCSMNTSGIPENNANGSSVAAFKASSLFKELWE